MIEPKTIDVTKGFITSGVKEIGSYIYVLMIDLSGQTIIKRVKSDNTEIKFVEMTEGSIEDFWSDPTVHTYKWIHEV